MNLSEWLWDCSLHLIIKNVPYNLKNKPSPASRRCVASRLLGFLRKATLLKLSISPRDSDRSSIRILK